MNKKLRKLLMIAPILVLAVLVAGFLPKILTFADSKGVIRSTVSSIKPTVAEPMVVELNPSSTPDSAKHQTKSGTLTQKAELRISRKEARDVALSKVDGEVIEFELDDDRYELEIRANGKKYEFKISAYTGEITEFTVHDLDKGRGKSTQPAAPSPSTRTSTTAKRSWISTEKAREIALDKVNGTIVEFEHDDDVYEIEVHASGKEYKIEINRYTGKITKFDDPGDDVHETDDHEADDHEADDHEGDDD